MGYRLDSGEITSQKVTFILVSVLVTVILLWNLVNAEGYFKYALVYLAFMTLPLILNVYDWFFKLGWTVTEEPKSTRPFGFLKKLPTKYHALIILFVCLFLLFTITSRGTAIITAPTFQSPEFVENSLYGAVMSGFVAFPETLMFFCTLFPFIFSWLYIKTKSESISLIGGIFLASLLFSLFHLSVYGTVNLGATIATFIFGALNCVWLYLFRSSTGLIIIHFVNNFVAISFSVVGVAIIGGLV